MPMLIPTLASWPFRSNGRVMASMIRSASAVALCCWSDPPSWMIANSSPPRPRQHVDFANLGFQAAADFFQQAVAGQMPARVVDVLELVEVEHHHGKRTAVALEPLARLLESCIELGAIGQSRQPVMPSQMNDLGLRAPS